MMQQTNRRVTEMFFQYFKRALVFIFKYRQRTVWRSIKVFRERREVQYVSMDGCHPPTAVKELRVGYNCAV